MSYNELNFLRGYLVSKKMINSCKALHYASQLHEGTYRSGNKEPYFYHPVQVASLLLSCGVEDDNVIAVALLHDVMEDCNVTSIDLLNNGFNEEIVLATSLLTKKSNFNKEIDNCDYYKDICENRIASIVKVSDRCHNLSTMGEAFSIDKMKRYINETKEYTVPLLKEARWKYPEYNNCYFIMKTIINATINNLEPLLKKIEDFNLIK